MIPPDITVPTVSISAQETDPGWRRVETSEIVKTYFQTYSFYPEPAWRISAYWGSEGLINRGTANYRSPQSIRAWLTVLPQLVRKVYRRVVNGWKLPPS